MWCWYFQAVLAVECEMKESIYGFHGNRKIPFLRITMALPKLVAPAKRILETGFKFAGFPERGYSTYESNIDYEVNAAHEISTKIFLICDKHKHNQHKHMQCHCSYLTVVPTCEVIMISTSC